jgi:molybdopterin converting factor small subunit
MSKQIDLHYYAQFRAARGRSSEVVATSAATPRELYEELGLMEVFPFRPGQLTVAVNDAFASWDISLESGDTVVFMTPMAGG